MRKFTKKQFYIFMFFAIASRIFEFFRAITKPPEVRFDFVVLYIISTIAFIILTIALWKNTKKDDGSAEKIMKIRILPLMKKRRSSFNYEERGQSSRKKI